MVGTDYAFGKAKNSLTDSDDLNKSDTGFGLEFYDRSVANGDGRDGSGTALASTEVAFSDFTSNNGFPSKPDEVWDEVGNITDTGIGANEATTTNSRYFNLSVPKIANDGNQFLPGTNGVADLSDNTVWDWANAHVFIKMSDDANGAGKISYESVGAAFISASAISVPEPASAIWIAATLGLVTLRRRRKRA